MATARKKKKGYICGTSSRNITNLKQSIFPFNIYDLNESIDMKHKLTTRVMFTATSFSLQPMNGSNKLVLHYTNLERLARDKQSSY